MTDISTGTLATSGTTTFIVGTSSGLDSAALIDLAVASTTQKADLIDIQISENDARVSAFDELQTLSLDLQTALDALKSNTGIAAESDSAFDQKGAFISATGGSSASDLVAVAVDNSAAEAQYEIEVLQTAEAAKVTGTAVADKDADLGYAGSFTLNLAGGASAQVDVTADLSLQEVADAINAVADTTGVDASILQVSETDFQLVLTAQETNRALEHTFVAGDDVLNLVGVTDGVGGYQNVLQAEQESIITLDGVTITRDDNILDDVLDGVEITLVNAEPGTTINLEVGNDSQAVKDAVVAFIDSYNALRDFIVQNQVVDSEGVVGESATLFSEPLLEGLSRDVVGLLGEEFANSPSIVTIRDLGLTFDSNNRLEISDETALDTAILNSLEDVRAFFESSHTSDNSDFALISNDSRFASQDIVFDITVSGGVITGVTANGDASAFTVSGTLLTGAEGTAYEGLVFSYQGTTSATINSSLTQGLGDRLYNTLEGYASTVDGLFQQEKLALQSQNDTLTAEADRIRELGEDVRQREIERFARLEANIERLRLLQNQIRSILGINSDE